LSLPFSLMKSLATGHRCTDKPTISEDREMSYSCFFPTFPILRNPQMLIKKLMLHKANKNQKLALCPSNSAAGLCLSLISDVVVT
jgi:hypothetical protein